MKNSEISQSAPDSFLLAVIFLLFLAIIILSLLTAYWRIYRVNRKMKLELDGYKKASGFLDNAPVIFFRHDFLGKISYINRVVTTQLGYTPEELTGSKLDALIPVEFNNSWSLYLKSLFDYKTFNGELNLRHRDGTVVPFECQSSLVEDEGHVQQSIGIARKSRLKSNHNLSEIRLQSLLDCLPSGGLITDHLWSIIYFGSGFCRMSGLSRTEISGRNLLDFIDAVSRVQLQRLADDASVNSITGKIITFRRKDESSLPVAMHATRIINDSSWSILLSETVGKQTQEEKVLNQTALVSDRLTKKPDSMESSARTVLLVDDNQTLLKMTAIVLERQGYAVMTAARVSDALQKLEKHEREIAVIVSDIFMPDVSGIQLAQEIAVKYPDLPIIILTGNVDAIPEELYSMKNIFSIIFKPAEPLKLSENINKAIELRADNKQWLQ
jgi:PAS domain S-box-containing protein